jgi:hypothetical protein
MLRIIRRSLSLILILLSIGLIAWAALPNQRQNYSQTISTADLQALNGVVSESGVSMSPRQLTLEWPGKLRIGKQDEITLIFEPVNNDGSTLTVQPVTDNIYDQYSLMAEGRFEIAGIRISPANPTRESLPEGQVVKFTWQVDADKTGIYDGTVWLSLRLLPLDGSPAIQVPIFIREIKIESTSLLGLNVSMAYILAGVGVMLSGILVFKDMVALMRKGKTKKTCKDAAI